MSYIDKIDEFCAEHKISQTRFEREAGISKGLISKWKNGKATPRIDSLQKAADRIGISVEDLMSEDPADFDRTSTVPDTWSQAPDIVREASVRYVPVFRYEDIGIQEEDASGIISHLAFLPETLEYAGECFGIRIEDSSMSPDIEPGDIAVVRQDSSPASGDVVIAVVPGEGTYCRRLIRSSGSIILQPYSRHFMPLIYREEELDMLPVIFKGKVIAVFRQMMSSACSVPEE